MTLYSRVTKSIKQGVRGSVERFFGLSAEATMQKTGPITTETKLSKVVKHKRQVYYKTSNRSDLQISKLDEAIRAAETPPYYNRYRLINLYKQAMDDADLSSEIETRKLKTLEEGFALVNDSGQVDEEKTKLLTKQWFYDFLDLALDSRFWGHSLIEFGELINGEFSEVILIDRCFVNPERKLFLVEPVSASSGLKYEDWEDVMEIGKPSDLGIIKKACRYVIWQSYTFSDWSRMAEKFGMPVVIFLLETNDENEIDKVLEAASELGSNGYMNLAKEDEVELLEQSKSDPHKIFQEFIATCTQKISKLVNGQSDVTNSHNVGSFAKAEVSEKVMNSRVLADMRWIANIINDKLLPYMVESDYQIEGLNFEWDLFGDRGPDKPNDKPVSSKEEDEDQDQRSFFVTDLRDGRKLEGQIRALYNKSCGVRHTRALGEDRFEKIVTRLAEEIFKAREAGLLDEDLLTHTAAQLWEGIVEGFGSNLDDLEEGSIPHKMLTAIQENVFVFSGFKTHQQLRDITDLLLDANGQPRSFSAFLAEVMQLNNQYNVNWLLAEYNHAIASSQMAAIWAQAEENQDLFDLEYDAVNDSRTRPIHKAIDGVIKPINDTFWDDWFPPNGWGCRCTIRQVDKGKQGKTIPEGLLPPEPMFANNVGKSGVAFPENHPYYLVGNQGTAEDIESQSQNLI